MSRASTISTGLGSVFALCIASACVGDDVTIDRSGQPTAAASSSSSSSGGMDDRVNSSSGAASTSSTSTSSGAASSTSSSSGMASSTSSSASSSSSSGGPMNFCDTLTAPTNADFLCADYEGGTLSTGWTRNTAVSGGGTRARTSAVFYSTPNAMDHRTPAVASPAKAEAFESYSVVGPKTIRSIELEFHINPTTTPGVVPPQGGTTELAQVGIPNFTATYTILEQSHTAAGGTRSHGVCFMDTRSAAVLFCDKITTALMPNVWTKVRLTMNASGGSTAVVRYNDVPVLTRSMSTYAATQATVSTGLSTRGDVNEVKMRYDNVVGTVAREP